MIYDGSVDEPTGLLNGEEVENISLGNTHSCAMSKSGKVYCFGQAAWGPLGTNTTEPHVYPVLIYDSSTSSQTGLLGGESAIGLTAGIYTKSSCAISALGKLYCWGDNTAGQLGINSKSRSYKPVLTYDSSTSSQTGLLDGSTVTSVTIGNHHTCAINALGKIYCWGRNIAGELGINSTTSKTAPEMIYDSSTSSQTGLLDGETAASITGAGTHSCAVSESGKLYCWGSNREGELGINTTTDSKIPEMIYDSSTGNQTGLLDGEKVVSASAGWNHTCAINESGKLYCWGQNAVGQLGINTTTDSKIPEMIYDSSTGSQTGLLAGERVKSVSVGQDNTCAISESDKLYCWGSNSYGVLGALSSENKSSVPMLIFDSSTGTWSGLLGGTGVLSVVVGYMKACAISKTGKLYCWGENLYEELALDNYHIPNEVVYPEDEICADGIDNDLDYFYDEEDCKCSDPDEILDDTCSAGTVGICLNSGVYTCNKETGVIVCNAVEGTPEKEICDGIDNNCDGSVDEDFVNKGMDCSVGLGICENRGVYVCKSDHTDTECSAAPKDIAEEITCANFNPSEDRNCDGTLDTTSDILNYGDECEGEEVGYGVCANTKGNLVCKEGGLVCQVEALNRAGDEVCFDNLDNDCDGETDEGCEPSPTPEYDECPDDPNKTEAGICGCGVKDEDLNNNGVPDCYDSGHNPGGIIKKKDKVLPPYVHKGWKHGKKKVFKIFAERVNQAVIEKGKKKIKKKPIYHMVIIYKPLKGKKEKAIKDVKKNSLSLKNVKNGEYRIRYRIDYKDKEKNKKLSDWSKTVVVKFKDGKIV